MELIGCQRGRMSLRPARYRPPGADSGEAGGAKRSNLTGFDALTSGLFHQIALSIHSSQ